MSRALVWLVLGVVAASCARPAPAPANDSLPGCAADPECRLCFCGAPPLGRCIPVGEIAAHPGCAQCREEPGWCGCQEGGCALYGLSPPTPDEVMPQGAPPVNVTLPRAPPAPRPSQPPALSLPPEPPDACSADADCIAATAGTNPELTKASRYGTLRDAEVTYKVLVACASRAYVQSFGDAQRLWTAGPAFDLAAPACRCDADRCAFAAQ